MYVLGFIALLAVGVITLAGGLDLPVGSLVLYFWLAVFCMMVFFVGFLASKQEGHLAGSTSGRDKSFYMRITK